MGHVTTDPRTLTPKLPAPKLLVGGRLVDPVEGGVLPVTNPATGERVMDAPAAGARDVDLAVKSARGVV
jgi:aldehyde dehydrogenase (NAD+)